LEAAWAAFLRILLYSIFHPLLRKHISKRKERIFFLSWSGKVIATTDKKVFLFWIVVVSVFMAWLRITLERYKKF
jgi:hypothetical protein